VHLPGGAEVLESDEAGHGIADVGVADRQVEREEERRADQEQHVERGRRQQRVAEHEPLRALSAPPLEGQAACGSLNRGGPDSGVRAAAERTCRHARLCLAKIRRYSPTPHFMTSSTFWPRAIRVNMSGTTNRLTTSWIGVVNGPG